MRIAFFIPGPLASVSGGYGYDRRIIDGLRAAGHGVEVVAFAGAPGDAWAGLGAGVVPVIDGLGLPAFAGLGEALAGRRTVGLIHHPTALETGLDAAEKAARTALERELFARLAVVIVTSADTAARVEEGFGVPAGRIVVVEPGTEAAARCVGSGGPECEILSVGSLIPRKGHDALLRSLARLFDLDWRLTIAGGAEDADYAASLRELSVTLGIAERVNFAGVVTGAALEALWARADMFALATHYEGYGMAVAEALKRGVPVVVTAGGAAGALVSPSAGSVCPVGDEVTLSKALRRMIYDAGLRAECRDAAWEVGQGLPDWTTQAGLFAAAIGRE